MHLKLKAGETFESEYGYVNGDYIAVFGHISKEPTEKHLEVFIDVYKDLAAQ